MWCMCFSLMFWDVLYLGCCVPLTCQFAVELLQEAGLSGVAGEKSKADWVGTRLMVDLCLCGGGKKKRVCEELHERVVGIPVQSLHAPSKNLNGSNTKNTQVTAVTDTFHPFARYHGHDY